MWSNLSSLAQKAKEAASLIEEQINDSIGLGDGAGDADGGERSARGSDGWEKCDDVLEDEGGNINGAGKVDATKEMSFVDLKDAAKDIPKNGSGELETDAPLLDALARVEALEKQVNSLQDQLAAAREESENYHQTNLLLEQQVKELAEENKTLKEASGASE